MLRFAEPVHIQLGHGESDKGAQRLQPAQGVRPDLRRRRRRPGSAGARPCATSTPEHGPCRSAGRSSTTTTRARRSGPRRSGCGSGTPRPGRATGRASATARWSATGRDRRRAARRPAGPGHLPAAPATGGLGRARVRPTRRSGPRWPPTGTGTWSTPARTAGSGGSPTLHHRRVRGGVRLAGDRKAAGDHRAGEPGPIGRRPDCWTPCRCCRRSAPGTSQCSDRPQARALTEGTRDRRLIALAEYYFGDTAEQASSARFERCHRPRARGGPDSELASGTTGRGGSPRRRRGPAAVGCFLVPSDSAFGRPRKSQPTAPESGRQMTAVAHSQRGIRRTAYGWACATSTTQ